MGIPNGPQVITHSKFISVFKQEDTFVMTIIYIQSLFTPKILLSSTQFGGGIV